MLTVGVGTALGHNSAGLTLHQCTLMYIATVCGVARGAFCGEDEAPGVRAVELHRRSLHLSFISPTLDLPSSTHFVTVFSHASSDSKASPGPFFKLWIFHFDARLHVLSTLLTGNRGDFRLSLCVTA